MKSSVSVVIPTYNRADLIVRSVESALTAVRPGDEILVIDDGSTDNTADVLRPYYGEIRYIETEIYTKGTSHNLGSGAGRARNLGIKLAKCPLVAFLDSDDEWMPEKLFLQRAVMDAYPQVIFCFTDLLSRHHDGKIFHNILNIWMNDSAVGHEDAKENLDQILDPAIPFSSIAGLPEGRPDFNVYIGDIYTTLMEVYWVWTCAIMVRKELAGKAFRFAEDLHIMEDWECVARMAKLGPAAYLDCELAVQNVHSGTRNTDVGGFQQTTDRISLLHRIWGSDESFLRVHSARFKNILKAQHLIRARYLIKQGRIAEAKQDLKIIGGGPWSYRLLASLPASLISTIIRMRRKILGMNTD